MKRCMGCMKEYEEEYELCPHCGYLEGEGAASEYHLPPGSILAGKYQMGKVMGFGGFGITYIGWDLLLERRVAIKEYLPSQYATRTREDCTLTIYSGEKEKKFLAGMEKFSDEAKRLAKFQGTDGIVQIYDTFMENKTAYIVMEYLKGETLKDRLEREGQIPVDEAIELMMPVLESLEIVHREGILHRDIAPDNVFLCKDEKGNTKAKLLDFGAARFATSHHSRSLSVLVKEGYSPYEQYRSDGEQGPWTDVYAVAATLYHMITGVKPQNSMERYSKDQVVSIRKLGVKIDKSTEAAIMNAMNITYEYRTRDATAFLEELRSDQVKRIHDRIIRTDIGRWPKWLKAVTSTAAAAVVVFVVLLATGVIHFDKGNPIGYEIPDGMTCVPNLLNMQKNKAKNKAEESELIFQISDSTYSDTIPKERVYAQDMLAGSIVEGKNEETGKLQTTIYVSMSLGVEKTYVPDVVHFMEAAAAEMIDESKLTYTVTQEQGDDAPGSVSFQSLAVNEQVEVGTELQLVVSTGMGFDSTVETTVPDVTNMKYDVGKTLALESSLYLAKQEVVYDQNIPENQIIEQSPAAGTPMNQDGTILVKVSAGAGIAHVPNVTYKSLGDAKTMLENEHLKVEIKYEDSDDVARDCVIRQSPEADVEVERGTTVTIYISNGNDLVAPEPTPPKPSITEEVHEQVEEAVQEQPTVKPDPPKKPDPSKEPGTPEEPEDTTVAVPRVTGKTRAEAEKELATAGFSCSVVEAYSSTVDKGKVISQSVAAGTEMEAGTLIILTVSKGPEPMAVPRVTGKAQAEAEKELASAGFSSSVVEAYSSTVDKGKVISQSVAAGTKVEPGTRIVLTVSKGPEPVAVPRVTGKAQAEAEKELASAGFSSSVVEAYSSTVDKGKVISQSVAAGTKVEPGTRIVLTVSKGPEPVAVPNVIGKSRADAESALSAVGLKCTVTEEFNDSVADGMVANQSVTANSQVMPGSSVTITVSKGPKAPEGWTTDGSFVNNPHYTAVPTTYYQRYDRHRTGANSNDYKTSTSLSAPSGYEYGRTEVSYVENGNWSEWSTTKPTELQSRKVESRQTSVQVGSHEEWYMARYYNGSDFKDKPLQGYQEVDGFWCRPSILKPANTAGSWSPENYVFDGWDGKYPYAHVSTKQEPDYADVTEYRYQDLTKVTTYYFYRTTYSQWEKTGNPTATKGSDTTTIKYEGVAGYIYYEK